MSQFVTFNEAVSHVLVMLRGHTGFTFEHKTAEDGRDISVSLGDVRPHHSENVVTGLWLSNPVILTGGIIGMVANSCSIQINTQVYVPEDDDSSPLVAVNNDGTYGVQLVQRFFNDSASVMSASKRFVFNGPYFSHFEN